MKRILKIIGTTVAIILVISIVLSIHLSAKVNALIKSANDNLGVMQKKYEDVIQDDEFNSMCYHIDGSEHYTENEMKGASEYDKCTFPITIWAFNKAYCYYWYSYELTDANGEALTGSWEIPMKVTLNFKSFRWQVTDVRENTAS